MVAAAADVGCHYSGTRSCLYWRYGRVPNVPRGHRPTGLAYPSNQTMTNIDKDEALCSGLHTVSTASTRMPFTNSTSYHGLRNRTFCARCVRNKSRGRPCAVSPIAFLVDLGECLDSTLSASGPTARSLSRWRYDMRTLWCFLSMKEFYLQIFVSLYNETQQNTTSFRLFQLSYGSLR